MDDDEHCYAEDVGGNLGGACGCARCRTESSITREDWRDSAQDMANDNRRLCNIVQAADELAKTVENAAITYPAMVRALQAYKIVRRGN